MINLERNKIDAVVQKRLESATEAVFILRSKEERAASLIQKLVRCLFIITIQLQRFISLNSFFISFLPRFIAYLLSVSINPLCFALSVSLITLPCCPPLKKNII